MVIVELENNWVKISFMGKGRESAKRFHLKNMTEFLSIYNAAKQWWRKADGDTKDVIYAPYEGEVKVAFDKIALSHKLKEGAIRTSFIPAFTSKYKLINFKKNGIIKLVTRKPKDKTSPLGICISNDHGDAFLSVYGSNQITKKDSPEKYEAWSNWMDNEYKRQLKQWVKQT